MSKIRPDSICQVGIESIGKRNNCLYFKNWRKKNRIYLVFFIFFPLTTRVSVPRSIILWMFLFNRLRFGFCCTFQALLIVWDKINNHDLVCMCVFVWKPYRTKLLKKIVWYFWYRRGGIRELWQLIDSITQGQYYVKNKNSSQRKALEVLAQLNFEH